MQHRGRIKFFSIRRATVFYFTVFAFFEGATVGSQVPGGSLLGAEVVQEYICRPLLIDGHKWDLCLGCEMRRARR